MPGHLRPRHRPAAGEHLCRPPVQLLAHRPGHPLAHGGRGERHGEAVASLRHLRQRRAVQGREQRRTAARRVCPGHGQQFVPGGRLAQHRGRPHDGPVRGGQRVRTAQHQFGQPHRNADRVHVGGRAPGTRARAQRAEQVGHHLRHAAGARMQPGDRLGRRPFAQGLRGGPPHPVHAPDAQPVPEDRESRRIGNGRDAQRQTAGAQLLGAVGEYGRQPLPRPLQGPAQPLPLLGCRPVHVVHQQKGGAPARLRPLLRRTAPPQDPTGRGRLRQAAQPVQRTTLAQARRALHEDEDRAASAERQTQGSQPGGPLHSGHVVDHRFPPACSARSPRSAPSARSPRPARGRAAPPRRAGRAS